MKVGITITKFDYPNQPDSIRDTLKDIVLAAEATGIDSLWVMDHFFQLHGPGSDEEPMLEAYTTLGYIAALTHKPDLGVLVSGVHFRYPGLLVKIMTTLDVLAGGRTYFGIGAGWYEFETTALGFPFPTTKERFELLEEQLQIAHQMWNKDNSPYHGTHNVLERPTLTPPPISKPHPKIMIGGGGEKKTLRFVAKYGDACNFFSHGNDTSEIEHKLAVLEQHCKNEGRDYQEIEKTVLDNYIKTTSNTDEIISHCKLLKQAGVDHIIFGLEKYHDTEHIKQLGKVVIPKIQKL